MPDYPKVPPRLVRILANNPLYFVTFCTHRRRNVLATEAVHSTFTEFAIRAYAEYYIRRSIRRYARSPYTFLFVGPDDFRLGQWVGRLKQHLAKAIELIEGSPPVWQRGFFDHLLRSNESYAQKWNYVRENPVRTGLAQRAEDWPYAGEIVIIDQA